MKKEYQILDGKVLFKDENNKNCIVNETDNIYEVIKQENFVEIIKNRKKETNDELKSSLNKGKTYKLLTKILPIITILSPLLLLVLNSLLFNNLYQDISISALNTSEYLNSSILQFMNTFNLTTYASYQTIFSTIIASCFTIPAGIILELCFEVFKKSNKKNAEILEEKLKYLAKKEIAEEDKLIDMRNKAHKLNINYQTKDFKLVKVDNTDDYALLEKEEQALVRSLRK